MLRISKATIRPISESVLDVLDQLGEGWQLVHTSAENNIFKKFVYGDEIIEEEK